MSLITMSMADANDGLVHMEFVYDNVSNVIQSISLTNNGASGSMTATLRDRTTDLPVFGPSTRAFGTGTFTQDLSHLGLLMVVVTTPKGIALQAPFNWQLSWAS